jgi:hypothetical protein
MASYMATWPASQMNKRAFIISISAMTGSEPMPSRSGIPGKTSAFGYHPQDHI